MSKLDIEQFIPEELRKRELYAEVKAVLQNFTDEEMTWFQDVLFKYKDPFHINREAAMEVIIELGYGYIADIFTTLTEEELGTIVSYMGIVHLLKGSTAGLKLIFDLLKIKYEMIQWHERDKDRRKGQEPDAPLLDTLEWKIVIDILGSPNLDDLFYTIPKLKNFTRNYVYPVLAYIEMVYFDVIDSFGIWSGGTWDEDESSSYIDTDGIIAFVTGCVDEYETSEHIQDFDPTLFDNGLLLETGANIYTEDSAILHLE